MFLNVLNFSLLILVFNINTSKINHNLLLPSESSLKESEIFENQVDNELDGFYWFSSFIDKIAKASRNHSELLKGHFKSIDKKDKNFDVDELEKYCQNKILNSLMVEH